MKIDINVERVADIIIFLILENVKNFENIKMIHNYASEITKY